MQLMRASSTTIFKFLIIVIGLCLSESSSAQGSPFSIQASLGASYLPMTKTSEFIQSWGYGDFKKTSMNVTGEVGFNYAFSQATSTMLKIGLLKTSSKFYPGFNEDPEAFAAWTLQMVPVSLGLECRLLKASERVFVFGSAGFGVCFSQVRQSSNYTESGEPTVPRIRRYNFPESKVTGTQATLEGSIGISLGITKSVSVVPVVDYEYALNSIKMRVEDHYGVEAFPEINVTNLRFGVGIQITL